MKFIKTFFDNVFISRIFEIKSINKYNIFNIIYKYKIMFYSDLEFKTFILNVVPKIYENI